MIPPYGTPPPYVAMYPHGGVYAHQSIPSVFYSIPINFLAWLESFHLLGNLWALGLICASLLVSQGSHPYGPYAMPSPNGTADVSVSIILFSLKILDSGCNHTNSQLSKRKKKRWLFLLNLPLNTIWLFLLNMPLQTIWLLLLNLPLSIFGMRSVYSLILRGTTIFLE